MECLGSKLLALTSFSFRCRGVTYPCALVQWYSRVSDEVDEATGMYIVEPDVYDDGTPVLKVVHLETIYRAVHLIAVYGDEVIPSDLTLDDSLDYFKHFYVSKFADHHMFDTLH